MDYVKDIVGNKVHVGDEVIYTEYKYGGFHRAEVTKVHPKSVTIKYTTNHFLNGRLYETERKCVSRFIKVVKEE